MRSRFFRIALTALTATGLSAGLAGCQMTRHSNTLVFGTNTSFGIKVGADATSTPGINVGYSRQEAVVIPVVANTADNGDVQAPCPQIAAPGIAKADLPINCVLMAKAGTDSDTLSVLASFGAKYSADIDGTGQGAAGQIAQYFATGLAARTLAANGGAATIALGSAARANANVLASDRMLGLMNSPAVQQQVAADLQTISSSRITIATKVAASGDVPGLVGKLDAAVADGSAPFAQLCPAGTMAVACANAIRSSSNLGLVPDQWKAAAAVN